MERIRNEVIQEQMEVQHNIIDISKEKQLTWYGDVRRMSEDRLQKKVFK